MSTDIESNGYRYPTVTTYRLPRTGECIEVQLHKLRHRRDVLQAYAESRMEIADRHGVQDAMSDLREMDAAIAALEWAMGDREEVGR